MIKRVLAPGMIAIAIASCGCSAFRSPTQLISVGCSEADATVVINARRCNLPAQIRVKRNSEMTIQAFKTGFRPYQRRVGYHLNGTGVLDIVGVLPTFGLSSIGLCCPGAISLDETDVYIQLYEREAAGPLGGS
jgi:hypothetical protein